MKDTARARRLADQVQRIVAGMLERGIKDPRLGFLTVTDTRVTGDLRDATVYYTVYGSDRERADTEAALESAKGVLRAEVGRRLGVRHTPSLTFALDELPDNARNIDTLLEQARAADADVAKVAELAEPAGERDPYRRASWDVENEAAEGPDSGAGDRSARVARDTFEDRG